MAGPVQGLSRARGARSPAVAGTAGGARAFESAGPRAGARVASRAPGTAWGGAERGGPSAPPSRRCCRPGPVRAGRVIGPCREEYQTAGRARSCPRPRAPGCAVIGVCLSLRRKDGAAGAALAEAGLRALPALAPSPWGPGSGPWFPGVPGAGWPGPAGRGPAGCPGQGGRGWREGGRGPRPPANRPPALRCSGLPAGARAAPPETLAAWPVRWVGIQPTF